MAIDRRTLEQLEACRPGSDDLQSADMAELARRVAEDPEVREAYRRAQQWDAAVGEAIERVNVPGDLAERLMKALDGAAAKSPIDSDAATVDPAALGTAAMIAAVGPDSPHSGAALDERTDTDEQATVALSDGGATGEHRTSRAGARTGWSRRRWLTAGLTVAAAVVVGAFVSQQFGRGEQTALETLADGWMAELQPTWLDVAKAPPRFEIPDSVTGEAIGWQRIGKIGGVRGVAYKLSHAAAGTARLFVVPLARGGLPTSPPTGPQSATGGKSIGYWKTNGLVYVLVVDGDDRSYRTFVSTARMPVA